MNTKALFWQGSIVVVPDGVNHPAHSDHIPIEGFPRVRQVLLLFLLLLHTTLSKDYVSTYCCVLLVL